MSDTFPPRRDISDMSKSNPITTSALGDPTSDLEVFAKEVLTTLITDNLPPTPNNFELYFDRLLEDKSASLRKQIKSVLEFEEDNDDEKNIILEKNLKEGFNSVKQILQVSATLYKNMGLMTKILETRQKELSDNTNAKSALESIHALDKDISKLNQILKKQITGIKEHYQDTATVIKQVENETIFDNQYGIYNKRYLLMKLEQEANLISEFKHKSTLLTISLSKKLITEVNNEKAQGLMSRTIARLLMKTSRRSDIVAHYGNGIFAMVLKHTDIQSAKMAAERLCDLVESSNFFLGDKEIQLRINIGIAEINTVISSEETLVCALDAMSSADNTASSYVICEKGLS